MEKGVHFNAGEPVPQWLLKTVNCTARFGCDCFAFEKDGKRHVYGNAEPLLILTGDDAGSGTATAPIHTVWHGITGDPKAS